MNNKKGFTVIEVLVVIGIVSTLLIFLIPGIINFTNKSKKTLFDSKIKTIESAAEKYANENINKFQNCTNNSFNSSKDEFMNKCTVSIDNLSKTGYVIKEDTKDGKDIIINPLNNKPLEGKIVLCYDANQIKVKSHYSNDGNYSCKNICKDEEKYFDLSHSEGSTYYGGNDVNVKIIGNNEGYSFKCKSEDESIAKCNLIDNNINIVPEKQRPVNREGEYDQVNIKIIGTSDKGVSQNKIYKLKIYDTKILSINLKNGSYTSKLSNESLNCKLEKGHDSCNVTLPKFTAINENFTAYGWSTIKDYKNEIIGMDQTIELSNKNNGRTYYANSIDDISPTCEFDKQQINIIKDNGIINVKCTDNGSGFPNNVELKQEDIKLTNDRVKILDIKSIEPRSENEVTFAINLKGNEYDHFHIGLKENSIKDKFDNPNIDVPTTDEIIITEPNFIKRWYIGKKNRPDVAAVLYDTGNNTGKLKIYDNRENKDIVYNDMLDFEQRGSIYDNLNNLAPWYNDYKDYITDIKIIPGVTNVGNYAFFEHSKLNTVTIPEGVTYIGKSSFSDSSLNAVLIPSTVKKIDTAAFKSNLKMYTPGIIPNKPMDNGQTSYNPGNISGNNYYNPIGKPGYGYLNGMENIAFANNSTLETIGIEAFYGNRIKNVNIPSSVVSIGEKAFQKHFFEQFNPTPIKLTFDENSNLVNINDYAFYNNKIATLEIPNKVENIGAHAFDSRYSFSVQKLSFRDISSLKNIGDYAFHNNMITSLIVPNSVIRIGDYAFTQLYIPEVNKNYNMTNLEFGKNSQLTHIGSHSFAGTTLEGTTLELPDSLVEIGDNAFGIMGRMSNVKLGSNVSIIGEKFIGGIKLSEINVDFRNKYFESIDGVLYTEDKKELVLVPDYYSKGRIDRILNIDKSTTRFRPKAIGGWNYLNSSYKLNLPSNINFLNENDNFKYAAISEINISDNNKYKTIDGVLYDNSLNTLLVIPGAYKNNILNVNNGTLTIANSAGIGQTKIKEITIPQSVNMIMEKAFFSNPKYGFATINLNSTGNLKYGMDSFMISRGVNPVPENITRTINVVDQQLYNRLKRNYITGNYMTYIINKTEVK